MKFFEKTAISSAFIRNAAKKRSTDLQWFRKVMSPETTHPEFLDNSQFGKIIGDPLKKYLGEYNVKTQNQLTNVMDRAKDPALKEDLAQLLAELF